jgi:acetyl-CoA carboxylase carboxyl transferase subunit alpha
LKTALVQGLEELSRLGASERRQLRYDKFRRMGVFAEAQ